ncbi:hypothetical protein ACK3TF_005719 [Chlorella vulgaris]
MACTDQAAAPPTAQTNTLQLDPSAFVEDLYNAVHFYCADGFDTMDSTLREQRGAVLTPEQQAAYHHGSSQLYLALRGEVDAQLQKFEAYALETCLHVPAGLLAQPSTVDAAGTVVDEAEEQAVDEQLQQLRQQIAAAKHHGRKLKGGLKQYDEALAKYSSTLATLQAVPAALAGKENSVAEDSRVLAAAGMQLEESCRQLDGLRQQKGAAQRGSSGQPEDELAAEREVLRCQAAVRNAPADDLRRLQERLTT